MVNDIVEGILSFLFRLFVEVICFFTGEAILYFLSIGNRKPRWAYYGNASTTKFMIMTEISVWIGMAFWIFIIGIIASAFV